MIATITKQNIKNLDIWTLEQIALTVSKYIEIGTAITSLDHNGDFNRGYNKALTDLKSEIEAATTRIGA